MKEEEAGSEDKLTTLATWAVLGWFEWSRAKIVYSERKAGSAIIPASIWRRQCSNGTKGGERRGTQRAMRKTTPWVWNSAGGGSVSLSKGGWDGWKRKKTVRQRGHYMNWKKNKKSWKVKHLININVMNNSLTPLHAVLITFSKPSQIRFQ